MNDVELVAQAILGLKNSDGLNIEELKGLANVKKRILADESVTKTTNGAFNDYKVLIFELTSSTENDATSITGQLLFFINNNKRFAQVFYALSKDYSKVVKFTVDVDFSENKFTYKGYNDSSGLINKKGSVNINNVWGVK